jgi:hypothetical protein
MQNSMRIGSLLLLALLTACHAPMQLPVNFVELREFGEGYQAVTSDDARLWVRDLDDPTRGTLDFWVDVLQQDFVEQRGYQLVASGEAKNVDGETGRWLEFTANVDGERVGYLVAVWWNPLSGLFGLGDRGVRLRIVEFAARGDVFTARVDAVRAALATVRRCRLG